MNAFLYFFFNLALLNLLIFALGLFVGWLIWGRLSQKNKVSTDDSALEAARSDIDSLQTSLDKEKEEHKRRAKELKVAQDKIVLLEKTGAKAGNQDCDCEEMKETLKRVKLHNEKLIKELGDSVQKEYESKLQKPSVSLYEGQTMAEFTASQLQLKERAKAFFSSELTSGQLVDDQSYGLVYTAIPAQEDDLTQIKGVGETLKKTLNEYGVFTFRQIAIWTPKVCEDFSERLSFKGRVERDNWIGQSKSLHVEKYGEPV